MQKALISVQWVSKVKGEPPCSGIKTRPKSRQIVLFCLLHEQTMTFIQKQVQSVILKFFGEKKISKIGNFLVQNKCKRSLPAARQSNTHACSFWCPQWWVPTLIFRKFKCLLEAATATGTQLTHTFCKPVLPSVSWRLAGTSFLVSAQLYWDFSNFIK